MAQKTGLDFAEMHENNAYNREDNKTVRRDSRMDYNNNRIGAKFAFNNLVENKKGATLVHNDEYLCLHIKRKIRHGTLEGDYYLEYVLPQYIAKGKTPPYIVWVQRRDSANIEVGSTKKDCSPA